jgi:hypothetical protein
MVKFSGDAVGCLSWSRKLSNGERGQHLDGCPLPVTNDGSVGMGVRYLLQMVAA